MIYLLPWLIICLLSPVMVDGYERSVSESLFPRLPGLKPGVMK